MKPEVSVIMPVYNGALYVRQAVESILAQTFADFEFLIIDDGSTDDTIDCITNYADKRIRLIRNETNIGLTRSLNRALRTARGRFVARQDADDMSEPHRLERQAEFMDLEPDCLVVGSYFTRIDHASEYVGQSQPPIEHDDILTCLVAGNAFAHGAVMFRRLVDQGYDENLPYAQDYEMWVRLARIGRLANMPEFLYKCRDHVERVSNVYREEQDHCAREVAAKHIQYMASTGRYDILCQAYFLYRRRANVAAAVRRALMREPAWKVRPRTTDCRPKLAEFSPCGREALKEIRFMNRCFGPWVALPWLLRVLVARSAGRLRKLGNDRINTSVHDTPTGEKNKC